MTDYGPRHRSSYDEEFSDCFISKERTESLWPDYFSISGPYPYRKSSSSVEMDDVVLEKFPARLASGEALPINPMTRSEIETTVTPSLVDIWYRNSYGLHHSFGDKVVIQSAGGAGLELYDEGVDLDVLASATLSAYANVDSAEVKILATLAELADTREMVFSAVKNVGKICKSIRSLNKTIREIEIAPENPMDLLTTAENTWMGIRMGWLPFAGDVQNIYNAITKAERPVWQTFRGVDSVSRSAETESVVPVTTPYKSIRTHIETQTVTARATILCERRVGGFPDTFGLTQIPSTLYDLLPLSWAIDYFFNFGDLIAATTPDAYWGPIRVSGSTRTEHLCRTSLTSAVPPIDPRYWGGFTGGGATWKKTHYVRRSDPPRAGILTSLDLNWVKITDLLIVGRQQMTNAVKTLFKRSKHSKNRKIRKMLHVK